MNRIILLSFSLFFICKTNIIQASGSGVIHLTSEGKNTTLLEVFSSQGCSSCPPAQRWVNKFLDDPNVWHTVVPAVFHVDYWDDLGWADPFASKAFSQRQRHYKRTGNVQSVYTPAFVVESREWKGWFSGKPIPYIHSHHKGQLAVTIQDASIDMAYSLTDRGTNTTSAPMRYYNVALLGLGVTTLVKRGENKGKALEENFIVLEHQQIEDSGAAFIQIPIFKTDIDAKGFAVVAWVTDADLTPLQVVAGKVPNRWVVKK